MWGLDSGQILVMDRSVPTETIRTGLGPRDGFAPTRALVGHRVLDGR